MTQLQQNRYDQLLRRVGDLKGPGSKVNDVLTELFPMIDVENVPAELLLLSGARLCMGTISETAGGALNFVHTFLRNPADSGVIIRLISVSIFSADAHAVNFGPSLNSATAGGARAFTDTRVFGEGTVGITQSDNNLLAAAVRFFQIQLQANVNQIFEPPAAIGVIAPGSSFGVGSDFANSALNVSYLWLERVAEPSELDL